MQMIVNLNFLSQQRRSSFLLPLGRALLSGRRKVDNTLLKGKNLIQSHLQVNNGSGRRFDRGGANEGVGLEQSLSAKRCWENLGFFLELPGVDLAVTLFKEDFEGMVDISANASKLLKK